MNNRSGSEITHPHGVCDECDFPYSYDPTDGGTVCVRCLKEKREYLQKLCEEHESAYRQFHKELDAAGIPTGHEIDRGKIVEVVEYPVNERIKLLAAKVEEQKGELAELKFVLMQRDAELTMRNDQLDKVRFQSDIYAKQVELKEELINDRSSQLATQTERIKRLEEAIEEIRTYAEKYGPQRDSFHLGFIQGRCEQALTTWKEKHS